MPKNGKVSVGFLFDDTLDSDDGVAQYVKRLGLWLESRGHRVVYLVGESKTQRCGRGKVYSLAKNYRVSWGGNQLSIPIWSSGSQINQVLKNENLDVLHLQFVYSPIMSQRVINRAGPSVAVATTAHVPPMGFLSDVGAKILRLIYGRSLKRIDTFVSVSSEAQKYTKDGFGIESEIIPNVVDVSQFKTGLTSRRQSEKIVFLGRLVKRKGCAELLRAFAIVAHQKPHARLIIAGDGPKRQELEAMAKRLGIDGQTKFLGYIEESAKPQLLASADIACFPSLYGESFGIVLIEAMAAGSGVVLGGDNPGYRSVLGERPEALINPKDSRAFAAHIVELLSNGELRQSLHSWQQKQVKKYDINTVGPQIEKLYAQAIANRAATRHN